MAICIPHASAQEGATQLEPITVEGDGKQNPKGPVKGFVAKTSATSTKTGTPLVETQQSISVITADELRAATMATAAPSRAGSLSHGDYRLILMASMKEPGP